MKSVCVYCGSRDGARPVYREQATRLGTAVARSGLTLVYGGGASGLMGAVADAALAASGQVIGVLPRGLARKEFAHPRLTTMHPVETMHERKQLMEQLADAFVALPGGFGTLDELFEIVTWAQIGLHRKPVGLLNTDGYWDGLLQQVRHAADEGFVHQGLRDVLLVDTSPEGLIDALQRREAPPPAIVWQA